MPNLSHLTTRVTDPVSGQLIPVVVTPDGGDAGTGLIDVADLAFGTLVKEAVDAFLRSGELVAGANMLIDFTDPTKITFTATSGASYTAENARNDVGAALRGQTGYLVVTLDDVGNTITYTLDPAFILRVTNLEGARSLVQVKENIASGGTGNYMNFPGGSGNYVSAPNNAAFNVAADLTVLARVKMPSSAPAADMTIASRWGADTAHGHWRWLLKTTGQMTALFTVDGVATTSNISTAVTPLVFDGNWIWLRITRSSADGKLDYYTAADTGSDNVLPTTWTTFQLNRATTVGALWNNAGTLSVPINIGAYINGTAQVYTGQIGRVIVYAGGSPTGTVVADANAADYTTGTTWAGPAGNTWTLNGTATVVGVGGGATTGLTTKFVLSDTDAFASIAVARKDTEYWWSQGGLLNTTGGSVNFTFELVVNSVILTTFPVIALPSVAASVYRYECSLTIEMSANDGTTQVYAWTLRIYDAVTGTYIGSQTSSLVLRDYGGNYAGALTTFTSIPKIELKLTMSSASAAAGPTNSRLALQKA